MMARIVKDHNQRYAEFLEVAEELFFGQGYEQTTVREIIDRVGVAKGTLYHYFDSKEAILEALVAQLSAERMALFEAIVIDDGLSAVEKLTRAIEMMGDWAFERKEELSTLVPAIQAEENVLLVHKLRAEEAASALPMVVKILEQGIEEGEFETPFVEETAEAVHAISNAFCNSLTEILLNRDAYDRPRAMARRKFAAAQTAIERVLGARPGSIQPDAHRFSRRFRDRVSLERADGLARGRVRPRDRWARSLDAARDKPGTGGGW